MILAMSYVTNIRYLLFISIILELLAKVPRSSAVCGWQIS